MPRSKRYRECTVCFKPVGQRTMGACPHCGAWIRPSLADTLSSPMWAWALGKRPGRPWVLLFYLTVAVVFGVVWIGIYALSEQGQARLLELALLVGGPLALVGLAWAAYRIWYRRRYPDE